MRRKLQKIFILIFPIVLAVGILLIPIVPNYDQHELAAQAVEMTGRWFGGHLLTAVAFGLSLFSVNAINQKLPKKLSPHTHLLLAIGAGLYAAGLGADGIGPVAVRAAGASPTLFFDGSGWWVIGTFIAATFFFGTGLISLVVTLNQNEILPRASGYIALISAVIFMAAPAIPSGYALYGEAAAALGVFIPIALAIE
ncbi:MAG: hypothetical protein GY803_27125 [Chloroflexi bacterium]|nr:hypothetical protein [Chloroflexota bacterium]